MIKDGEFTLPESPIPKATVGPPMAKKDLVIDMNFEVVTDVETTYKYNKHRKQMLEMFSGCEDGKGILKDETENSWTFEKTEENGSKVHYFFKNEVLVENKQMDKDLTIQDENGVRFNIHSTYIFTASENGTNIQRLLTNFNGKAPILNFLPKGVVHENGVV